MDRQRRDWLKTSAAASAGALAAGALPASAQTSGVLVCGLDMTRRDLQQAMGNEKKPWEIGKSFVHSAGASRTR